MGSVTNSTREGRISQKTFTARELILVTSFVSIYSQNIARTETNGIEASTAPISVLRLAISDMITMRVVVIAILAR